MKLKRINVPEKWRKPLKILLTIALIGLAGAGLYFGMQAYGPVSRVTSETAGERKPTVTIVPSPLTGLDTTDILADRPVTGIVIENSPAARPQSGLQESGVIFEAIAEGGITRFVTFYQESQPELIGPVRSLRPYFLDWAMGFDSSVAHVGGSSEALKQARSIADFRDLDQFSNGKYFFRSSDRYAPHNMYTRMSLLDEASEKLGYKASEFTPIPRKKDSPAEKPTAKNITVDFSTNLYQTSYTYRPAKNDYIRSLAGAKHIDRESGNPLSTKVVVVMKMQWSVASTGHSVYTTIGNGEAFVFQDGKVTRGTWSKAGRSSPIVLKDGKGEQLPLNAGQVWFSALPSSRSVSYQ